MEAGPRMQTVQLLHKPADKHHDTGGEVGLTSELGLHHFSRICKTSIKLSISWE
jgi:hypothetical protein